jgi:hypothetical protein
MMFGGMIFRTTKLTFSMELTSILLGASVLIVGALIKFIREDWVNKHL